MTKNHKQILQKKNGDFITDTIENLKFNKKRIILNGQKNDGKNFLTDLERLYIAIQADGCLVYKKKNNKEFCYQIKLKKQKKINRLLYLLNKTGVKYSNISCNNNAKRWNIWLKKENLKELYNTFSLNVTSNYADEFINEISLWDGSQLKNNGKYYSSKDKRNVDFVCAMAVIGGYKCYQSLQKDKRNEKFNDIHRLFLYKQNTKDCQTLKKEKIYINETMYCIEVPSHYFICRKNGFSFVTGNCQNVCSNPSQITQYEKILNNLVAEYRISLSATPKRMDGLTNAMFALCGKIKHEITSEEVADKTIKAEITPIYTNYIISKKCMKYDGTLNYQKMPTEMAINEERNQLILDLLKQNKGNYNLILSDRLEGLELLWKTLGEGKFINGQMTSKAAKKEREEAIQLMRDKKEHYLFASFSLAKEGLDIKNLDRLFLIAPTKNSNVLIQSVGRIERSEEGKETPIVYDFVDINSLYYEKMWKARKTIYKKNGNKILE